MVTPEQKVNLLSENQILDAKQAGNNKKFKYKIIRMRNEQDEMEGFNIIINMENNKRIHTKRDRRYHEFHRLTLTQLKYLEKKEACEIC